MNVTLILFLCLAFYKSTVQAATSDFTFSFTGYKRQNKNFTFNSCPKNVKVNSDQTVSSINQSLQGDAIEIPTNNKDKTHVECITDSIMGNVAKLTLYKSDNDPTGHTDRQRIEMKANEGSKPLVAKKGSSFIYAWWFYLDPDMTPGDDFYHIFQIKGVGNQEKYTTYALATLTFTIKNKFHLRLHDMSGNYDPPRVLIGDLTTVKGKWIQVFVKAVFNTKGSIQVDMKDQKGNSLLKKEFKSNHTMWWDGADYFRPKWGLYRKKTSAMPQSSNWQLFQNIEIWKK